MSWFTHGSLLLILSLFDYQVLNAQKYVACPGTPTVKDFDGNEYNTVQIGTQCWMKENLRVSRYKDGSNIPNGLDYTTWRNTSSGAYTIYNDDNANDLIYGKLYNWYAVADNRGLCPNGWHVPSDVEWTTLTTYLGGESVAGGKMKSRGITYWNSPNKRATNVSGFSALPGGFRNNDGSFDRIRLNAFFWSATAEDVNYFVPWCRYLYYNYGSVGRNPNGEHSGFSVRCLRD